MSYFGQIGYILSNASGPLVEVLLWIGPTPKMDLKCSEIPSFVASEVLLKTVLNVA